MTAVVHFPFAKHGLSKLSGNTAISAAGENKVNRMEDFKKQLLVENSTTIFM